MDRQVSELNVALFSTNLKKIQKLSMALRKHGIFAAFYQELPALINHINQNQCHLVIVDYGLFDQVHRLLNIHPKLESNETLVGLFSQEDDFAFEENFWANSNYHPVALFNDSPSLINHLGTMLHWINIFAYNQNNSLGLKRELGLVRDRFETYLVETEKAHKGYQQLRNVSAVVRSVYNQNIRDKESYLIAISKMFEQWEGIQSYGFYSLNSTNQKLTPLDMISKKHKTLPPLRMGKICENGIEKFAQEMAYQVAFDEMGMNTVALRIEGSMKNPEILCFLSFTEKEFSNVDDNYHWNLFETLLSNVYRRIILQSFDVEVETQFLPVWDFLNFLDEERSDESEYKFINIDLAKLNHFIAKNPERRFYWKSFFNDFLIELSKKLDANTKISTFGTSSVLIALDSTQLAKQFHAIKELLVKYEYWSYFSDTSMVIPQYVYPEACLIPGSSSYFIRKNENLNQRVKAQVSSYETTINP